MNSKAKVEDLEEKVALVRHFPPITTQYIFHQSQHNIIMYQHIVIKPADKGGAGDPKTWNGGMAEWRNGGKDPIH